MGDELMEVADKQTMRREQAAEKLRDLADQLSRHNQVEFSRDGIKYAVKVPDEVLLKIEVEVGEESEIEIELSW